MLELATLDVRRIRLAAMAGEITPEHAAKVVNEIAERIAKFTN